MSDENEEQEIEVGAVAGFKPSAVHTYFPVKGGVLIEDDGSVTFRFNTRNLEIVCINIPEEAAAALREQLPSSSGIVTPPKPTLIVPH